MGVSQGHRIPDTEIRVGVAVSIAIHIILFASIHLSSQDTSLPSPFVVDVSLVRLPEPTRSEPARSQIVSPSTESNDQTPQEPKYLSDRDNTVARDQIRRGLPDAQPIPPAPRDVPAERPKRAAPPSAESPPRRITRADRADSKSAPEPGPAKSISSLKLDSGTLLDRFSQSAPSSSRSSDASPRPFSRPSGSGAAFYGTLGTPDYLPNLPDGDLTLLNTKANQFAVFVRRVASQVFAQIRSQGWDLLAFSDVRSISDFAVIRATLSPTGQLISVTLQGESGSNRFDRVIVEAARKGATDPNPPKAAAAADGNFYFIFKAKSWAQPFNNPRTGAPSERRWLLLQTGLE